MKINPALSAMLKEIRINTKMSQAQVAERLGVTQPTVAGYEVEGADLQIATLKRLLSVYDVKLSIDVVMPDGEIQPVLQPTAVASTVVLRGTELEIIREYNDDGTLADIRLELCLTKDGEYFSSVTIDRDRLPAARTNEAVLEIAKGSMTFEPEHPLTDDDYVLNLTYHQLMLIGSVMYEIERHKETLK